MFYCPLTESTVYSQPHRSDDTPVIERGGEKEREREREREREWEIDGERAFRSNKVEGELITCSTFVTSIAISLSCDKITSLIGLPSVCSNSDHSDDEMSSLVVLSDGSTRITPSLED